MLLTFNSKYLVSSGVAVTTNLVALQDDTEASQTFALTANKVVLVIYAANSVHGATAYQEGMKNAISVDGADYANCWDSPYAANHATRNTPFWIGTLGVGNHTIKGRFASNVAAQTVTVSNRTLVIIIFNGNEFQYVDDTTAASDNSGGLVDDPNAQVTFTPSGVCKALVLYNASNIVGETMGGKRVAINIAGVDYGVAAKSPYQWFVTAYYDSVFTVHAKSLAAIATTVKGRYGSWNPFTTTRIDERELGVLLLDDSTLLDMVTSAVAVATISNALVDDAQATINRNTVDTRELLVVAMGTLYYNGVLVSDITGSCYGIKINANDRANSRGSPDANITPTSEATAYAEQLAAGAHIVQGRFSNNSNAVNIIISARQVAALWFLPAGGATKPKGNIASQCKVVGII